MARDECTGDLAKDWTQSLGYRVFSFILLEHQESSSSRRPSSMASSISS